MVLKKISSILIFCIINLKINLRYYICKPKIVNKNRSNEHVYYIPIPIPTVQSDQFFINIANRKTKENSKIESKYKIYFKKSDKKFD